MRGTTHNTRRGFTLIELLVVIAIIGILSAIGLVSLQGSREKARDAQRMSELAQISKAMLIYHDDYSDYPTNRNDNGAGSFECGNTSIASGVFLSVLIDNYLSTVPRDPVASSAQPCSYRYKRLSESAYQLVANLESKAESRLCKLGGGTFCQNAGDRCWCVEP